MAEHARLLQVVRCGRLRATSLDARSSKGQRGRRRGVAASPSVSRALREQVDRVLHPAARKVALRDAAPCSLVRAGSAGDGG